MKRLILFLLLSLSAFAANGDITAVRISSQTQRSVTDAAITSGAPTFTSATATFTSADVGKWVYINGAGASGALLTTKISAFTNSTTVTVANNASTTCAANCTAHIGNYQNGFIAEIDITGLSTGGTYAMGLGTNNDASTAKVVFTVTSPGYDATGALGTVVRTIYGTKQVRETYPNQAVNDEVSSGGTLTVRVSLSDFIYAADTVTLTVAAGFYTQGTASNAVAALTATNSSTLSWADTKSVGRWAWPVQFTTVTGNFALEAVIFNRFAKNGKPLAAVKMQCSDAHSHTAGPYTVTAMTKSTSLASDRNTVQAYIQTIDVSTLTQGDVLTCNFKAYPWAGDATAVLDSNSGVTQPAVTLSDLLLVNDKSGTYGSAAAVVDATNGHASALATWVSANQAAAEASYASSTANSYTTLTNAAAALKAYNNTNFSRNEPGGGIVLVTGTTNDLGTTGANLGASKTWLTVTHLSTSSSAAAGFTTGGNGHSPDVNLIRFYDLTFTSAGDFFFWSAWSGAGGNVLWLDKNTLNLTSANQVFVSQTVGYATANDITALGSTNLGFSNGLRWTLVRGNAGPAGNGIPADGDTMLGNSNLRPFYDGVQLADNFITAFNSHLGYNLNTFWSDSTSYVITSGGAIVQNLVEAVGTAGCLIIEGTQDAGTTASNNILLWHNTCMGERGNFAYNWRATPYGAVPITNWSMRGNLWDGYNSKQDTASLQGAPTGGWTNGWGVGHASNLKRHTVTEAGDFIGLMSINDQSGSVTSDFVNCAATNYNSNGCSGLGGGDYHLKVASRFRSLVPAGMAVLPYDLDGVARSNTGTGSVGAFAFATEAPTGGACALSLLGVGC